MRLFRWLRDLWVIAGITLLAMVIIDAGLKEILPDPFAKVDARVRAPSRQAAPAYSNVPWVDDYWRDHDGAKSMQWRSYVYWRRAPFRSEHVNVDEAGLRETTSSANSDVTVWVFGGSSVWGSGVPDALTVPSLLVRELADRGIAARVLNFGESGYVSRQSLLTLLDALDGRETPDWVIFLEGANDVFAALQAGAAGMPQNETHRAIEFRASDDWRALVRVVFAHLQGIGRLIAPAPEQFDIPALAEGVIDEFGSNINHARTLGERHGFSVLAYWQPTVFSRERPNAFEAQIVAASLALHRDLQVEADRLARTESRFGSLASIFDGTDQPIYLDFVHIGPAGNARLAGRIADDLMRATSESP